MTGLPWLRRSSLIDLENQIVFELRAALRIAASGLNGELGCGLRVDLQREVEGHGGCVKTRAKIRRGCRHAKVNLSGRGGERIQA